MTYTLVMGGTRSGKSAFSETLVMRTSPPWRYVATAQVFDSEMRERIAVHQARRDSRWETIEAPLSLEDALDTPHPVLIDCLTLWLSNLIHANMDPHRETRKLVELLLRRTAETVIVSSEVGLGILPPNALARRFADAAGQMHQELARNAAHLVLVVAGHPLHIK